MRLSLSNSTVDYLTDAQVIRMHFANLDASGYGPLTTLRKEARLAVLIVGSTGKGLERGSLTNWTGPRIHCRQNNQ